MINNNGESTQGRTSSMWTEIAPYYFDVIGIACFSIWQNAQLRFFFPSSNGMSASPLLVFNLAAVALAVFCFVNYRRNTGRALPFVWFVGLIVVGTIAGSLGSGLVARSLLPLWGIYVAAVFSGFSVAALCYAWAFRLLSVSSERAFATIALAVLLASFLELLGMNVSSALIPWFLVLSGVGMCVCFIRQPDRGVAELVYRPTQVHDYTMLAIGLLVLAGALGIVAGSTANVCTEESMRELNVLVTVYGVICSMFCLAVVCIWRERLDWMAFMRVTPSVMLIGVLLNILYPDQSQYFLALTLFGWNAVRLLVFLFIVEVARKRIVSLSLIFPIAWSLLMAGHGVGVFIAQSFLPAYPETGDFAFMVVLVAILVSCSSMFILGNKLVLGLMASNPTAQLGETFVGAQAEEGADAHDAADSSSHAEEEPPGEVMAAGLASSDLPSSEGGFEVRCHAIAASHHLSAREEEVMVLLAKGNTRASIAKRLFISENTVRAHVKNIYAKLYIHSKQQLINMVDGD